MVSHVAGEAGSESFGGDELEGVADGGGIALIPWLADEHSKNAPVGIDERPRIAALALAVVHTGVEGMRTIRSMARC